MQCSISERVYIGKDNVISLELLENDDPVPSSFYASMTKVEVEIAGAILADSDTNPTWFDWTQDRLDMILGHSGITEGSYTATLNIFTVTDTNGLKWEPSILLTAI